MKLINKNSIRKFLPQNIIVLLCLFVSINSFCQNFSTLELTDDAIIKKIEAIQFKNPDSAIRLYSEVCVLYKKENRIEDYHIVQTKIANIYIGQQKNNEALKIYEASRKYFASKNDSARLFEIYSGIAGVCYNLNDIKKSISYLENAEKMCNELQHPNLKFICILNLENCFLANGLYDSALACCQRANLLLKFLKSPSYDCVLKSKFGMLYYLKHQYDVAINCELQALKINNKLDNRLSTDAYKVLGLCYLDTKKYELSNQYFDSALIMSTLINSKKDYWEILQSKFQIDTLTKNYKNGCKNLLSIIETKDSLFEINKNSLTNELLIKYEAEKREAERVLLEIENKKREHIIQQQRLLILLSTILFIIIITILFFYLRFRNAQQKKIAQKEQITAKLQALKAQLDPHFIQNIFQLISNQVVINPSQVSTFLQKTANYFRSILYNSDITVQPLEDEILFTEKYLEFQQLLFQDQLTYQINIANDVDCYEILVPAMLLQPFIENSVKYGLQQSQKPMHINIDISISNNYLIILIIDNGHFMPNENNENNKSFGIDLISKRLQLFYESTHQKPLLTAVADDNNNGFKVSLSLPLK